ncbi:MAG: radical SAM protein [Candidatus Eisenbacteria bacterium]|uniref:Radical SAM protein n=1 Tax=Eiseniibacteriota bacterium TaxID=2212470 RepID=A0A538UCT3_UNCEI|nr:MAG: radical SAM protein [Candidatus Eisenbacteria bacterium]
MTASRMRWIPRAIGKIVGGLVNEDHPILVHIIPMRRCNLACTYCNEFDAISQPVPLDVMTRRADKLAELGTAAITISGGEPLLHPDLPTIIARIRERGMIVTLITNGYLLTLARIDALNDAGLDHLEISIDNVEPDEVSKKSLRVIDPKLKWLAERARFTVSINSVIGTGVRHPEDALIVARRARELGFMSSVGIVHDGGGQLKPLGEREMAIYREIRTMGQGLMHVNGAFQDRLAEGKANTWRCRAGARYLYVDEDGLVHYCSQQRGYPAIPLESYTVEDIRREYRTEKACAPYCTVNCVQQVGLMDNWRSPQTAGVVSPTAGVSAPAPAPVTLAK